MVKATGLRTPLPAGATGACTHGTYIPNTVIPTRLSPHKIVQLVEHKVVNCGLRDKKKRQPPRACTKLTMDPENRFELFLLDEGQQKVEEKAETRKSPTNSRRCF